jgi:hypothetical protein
MRPNGYSPGSLRLQLYKGLGVEPIADENGTIIKMLVSKYHLSATNAQHLIIHQGQDVVTSTP